MRARAFTLVDALVGIVVMSILIGIVGAGLTRVRNASPLQVCIDRLRGIGEGHAAFALAHKGQFAGFTWAQGGASSQYADLNALQAIGPVQAHAAQAADILRRRVREDMPAIDGWIPDVKYWMLPLAEFLGTDPWDEGDICPADPHQLAWRRSPDEFDRGAFWPLQPYPGEYNRRIPYASSYTPTGSAFDRNQSVPGTAARRIQHNGSSQVYTNPPGASLGPSSLALVAFPSAKAQTFDTADRHFAPEPVYFAAADARGPILFFDGAVGVHRSGDARTPWTPQDPLEVPRPQRYEYQPQRWEPRTISGMPSEIVIDRYRWTRGGLGGWDFQN